MKLEQGDLFEAENADWIREKLPHYEHVWSRFIGHDGQGNPCVIPGLDEQKSQDRLIFAQAHYSIFFDMIILDQISADVKSDLGKINNGSDFIRRYRQFTEIVTLIGHVRDMFKLMSNKFGKKDELSETLQNFYDTRSHVMHGSKTPTRVDENGLLMLPVIASRNETEGEWSGQQVWQEIASQKFEYYSDTCEKLINQFFKSVNEVHGSVYGACVSAFGSHGIKEPDAGIDPTQLSSSGNFPPYFFTKPVSGSFT